MKQKQAPLILLPFLAAFILVSGCTGLDPTALAKSNSMIQQFLSDHPNAQIVVTHFTANQSKYMIDQIRKDCDNPYLDEKEFYRVNITDPDTNFYAIVWIDWETKTVECVFKIGTEGKTVEKPNTGNCTNHAYSKCYNSHIYWFDSCGNVQEKKEYCKQGCSDKECTGECKSNAEYRCYGDNLYWFDSCGNVQEKKDYCQYGCENGFCKTQRPEKTCENAGGYCIWPQGYCGDGICSESDKEQICEKVCPSCQADTAASCQSVNCTKVCKYICPQDCGIIPSSEGGGESGSGQAICENRCAKPDIKFADSWTDKESYSIGEAVKFSAKLTDNNGNPATPGQGNIVYLFAISPKTGLSTSSAPISYNYSTGYYEFSTPPIPSNIDSGTWGFYATAQSNESFAVGEIAYVAINSAAPAASLPAIPAQYEGCASQCLLIAKIAQPLKISPSLASAVAGGHSVSTGMVVAMEVTATSTVVSYQCKDGYEIGKYFCKEGGICCVPQTTPPETGFCGSSTQGPCSSNSECAATGCSGQVCQSIKEEKAATTCEYKDCYNAAKYGMVCRCVKDSASAQATAAITGAAQETGRCMWTKPVPCTDDAKVCPDGSTVSRNPNKNCEFDLCPTAPGNCANEGGFCGGIAAIQCCSGLTCQLDGTYPDAGGKCIKTCAKEGEQFSLVYKEKYPEHCCSGLTEWESGMDTRRAENGVCVETNLVAGSPIGTCINCGDGICGKYENVCNCPQDCKAETCTDSDGGINYYSPGLCSSCGTSSQPCLAAMDYCTDSTQLSECYCSGTSINYSYYSCPYGCFKDACLQQANNTNAMQ